MPPNSNERDLFHVYVYTSENGSPQSKKYPFSKFVHSNFDVSEVKNGNLTWLHVPANNMKWVEEFMNKWYPKSSGLDKKSWDLKLRPALSHVKMPSHSRHMEPSCTAVAPDPADSPKTAVLSDNLVDYISPPTHLLQVDSKDGPLVYLYLPYMNWELYKDFQDRRDISLMKVPFPITKRHAMEGYLDREIKKDTNERTNEQPDEETNAEMEERMGEEEKRQVRKKAKKETRAHPRRTLDQFFYSSLPDTQKRDSDQTVSKWTGAGLQEEGRSEAKNDSLMIMIDQLWCWVLDKTTIVSFFPSHDLQTSDSGFLELHESMAKQYIYCETVWDLYSTLIKEAVTFLFNQENKGIADLLEIYRWVVNKKVARQTSLFEAFHDDHSSGGPMNSALLDDKQELSLVLEVSDIADELKMIRHIVNKQRDVVKDFMSALSQLNPEKDKENQGGVEAHIHNNHSKDGSKMNNIISVQMSAATTMSQAIHYLAKRIAGKSSNMLVALDGELELFLTDLDTIKKDADSAHQELLDLLDLKQKAAALAEARATSQQGRVIMLFTIVTIIFLPLSFFTSYFGQNVSEITGDENNPTTWDLWRYGTPISIAVILFALVIAYRIGGPDTRLWFFLLPIRRSEAV